MHTAAHEWVAAHAPTEPVTVIDVGGRNINGTVRDLFHSASRFTVVDLETGPNVDVVADFRMYRPPAPVDVVVCCEVAEHTPHWPDLLDHAADVLRPGGLLIFTAAGDGRSPHSGHDGGLCQPDEWYQNIPLSSLNAVLSRWFANYIVDVTSDDIRAAARR